MNVEEKIVLRPPQLADLKPVETIEHASFGDPWSRLALFQELQVDQLRCPLIAECDGQVVGYLMAWCAEDQLHILNIAVSESLRRRGIGSRLVAAARTQALARNLSEITLEVRDSNRAAKNFYFKHGYRQTGTRPGYYADTGEDAVIMTLSLADGGSG